jgi:hypothetical protein
MLESLKSLPRTLWLFEGIAGATTSLLEPISGAIAECIPPTRMLLVAALLDSAVLADFCPV